MSKRVRLALPARLQFGTTETAIVEKAADETCTATVITTATLTRGT
jgi:hypothetical protein